MTTPKTKPATALRVAGEVQMKALSHDMGVLRRNNERLRAERAELVAALKELVADADAFDDVSGMQEVRVETCDKLRALLRKLGEAS